MRAPASDQRSEGVYRRFGRAGDGIELAARIKQRSPQTAILFLTAYREYAFDAWSVRPSGYLLKPVSLEKLAEEVRHACGGQADPAPAHIRVRTFGEFDVFVDGKPIHFKLAKAREILAYLVDKQGLYDRGMQKQLDVYIRSLRETLRACGAEEILRIDRGVLRVDPERFVCDAYLFFSGDSDMINAYRGEYMNTYSWASMTESILTWSTIK